MKNWIPIDRYGKCTAGGDCDNTCFKNLGTKYKFYLSFENSLCKDYVTEKLWRILGKIFELLLELDNLNNWYFSDEAYLKLKDISTTTFLCFLENIKSLKI